MARLKKHLAHEQRTLEMLDKRSHQNLAEGSDVIPEHDLEISRELQNFLRQALKDVKYDIALRSETKDHFATELTVANTSIYEMNGGDRELVIQKVLSEARVQEILYPKGLPQAFSPVTTNEACGSSVLAGK